MSFWLGVTLLAVGFMALVLFGVVDRFVRWVLPESHWRRLQAKGAEVRRHGEEELGLRASQFKAQAGVMDRAVEATGLPGWAMIVVGVVLLVVHVVLLGLVFGWWAF